jgi:hypothetical protein
MPEFPHSPEEVIDPRWKRYLHAHQPVSPATGGAVGEGPSGGPGVQPAHHASDAELNAELARVLGPWRTGRSGPRETLEALRELAERLL